MSWLKDIYSEHARSRCVSFVQYAYQTVDTEQCELFGKLAGISFEIAEYISKNKLEITDNIEEQLQKFLYAFVQIKQVGNEFITIATVDELKQIVEYALPIINIAEKQNKL